MKQTILSFLSLLLCAGLLVGCSGGATPVDAVGETPSEASPAAVAEALPPSAAPEQEPDFAYGGDRFVGQWEDGYSQRAYMMILPADHYGVYRVVLHWGDSAFSFAEWDMTASRDEASDSIRYTDGSRFYVSLREDGTEDRALDWDSSEGRFFFEGSVLHWEDSKEESAGDLFFSRLTAEAPSAEDLIENYFRPVLSVAPGTSGTMLRTAQAAYTSLRFASDRALWSGDMSALHARLGEAWAGLSAEEKAAFEESVYAVQELVVNSSVSWADYEAIFADAGIDGSEMQALEADPAAMESLCRLFDSAVAACLN